MVNPTQEELKHYGVLGMKWGVRRYRNNDGSLTEAGKRRDAKLRQKVKSLSEKSTTYSTKATSQATNKINGSRSLDRSNRYMRRASKVIDRMSDKGKSVKSTKYWKNATQANRKAGEFYVKRKMSHRVKDAVSTAVLSTGASFVGFALGMPIGALYINPGPKYDLKHGGWLLHADKKKHKYVAKVKIKNNKYRYFYDKEEYQRWLNGKKKIEQLSDKLGDGVKSIKNASKNAKKKIDKFLNKYGDKKKSEINGLTLFYTKKQFEKAVEFVKKLFTEKSEEKTEPKKPKYIAKVELPNGKPRYFYDQAEYDAYLKRLEYQKNEPEFMKGVRKIDPNVVMNSEENMGEINEEYDSSMGDSRSMNCMYCTTAYELRMRGYDVQAADYVEGKYEGTYWGVEKWYEDAVVYDMNQGGKVTDLSKYTDDPDGSEKYWKSKHSPDRNYGTAGDKEYGLSSKDMADAIKKVSPPNSRGNLIVWWPSGGGHSMAYEVDKSNNITVRDCQTNDVYTLDAIAPQIADAAVVRTDNLKLKKGVLKTVEQN